MTTADAGSDRLRGPHQPRSPHTADRDRRGSMGRIWRLTMCLVALVVLAAIAAAASANGAATVTRQDVTGETVSCDNGILSVTAGSFQTVVHETQTASGAYHLVLEGTAQGVQAIGPSGAKYLIPGGFHIELNLTRGATTSMETDVLNVIGQGGAPNFTARGVLHVTVDANGDVTASVDHFTATGNCVV